MQNSSLKQKWHQFLERILKSLSRLVGRQPKEVANDHIQSRVEKLRQIASKSLNRLEKETEKLKKEVVNKGEREVISYLERAVQPIIKKADAITSSDTQRKVMEQVTALEDLILKADIYTRLISNRKNTSKDKVQALFNQWAHDRIEQDLTVIKRYQEYRIEQLNLAESEKNLLIQNIESQLERLRVSLEELPENINIEEIERKRDEYTNFAYHVIDQATNTETNGSDETAIVDLREYGILEQELLTLREDIEQARQKGVLQEKREDLAGELSKLEEMVKEEARSLQAWNPDLKRELDDLEDKLQAAWEALLNEELDEMDKLDF